jgi:hypothetical protein
MPRLFLTILFCLLFYNIPVWGTDVSEPTTSDETDVWSRTRETTDEWWQRSQETAVEWWEHSRKTASEAWESTHGLFKDGDQDHFDKIWDRIFPKLEDTLTLQERQAELPESSWFGSDQQSNLKAINELLDETVDILSTSSVEGHRERIRVLKTEITKARQDISDYRRKRISAPTESLVKKTVEDYGRAIEEREADIARYEEDFTAIKREFAAELRDLGLELSDEQVDFLLSTVVGDNIIDLGIVFDNVKAITVQLEMLVEQSGENLESARRYYGLYVVLLKSLNHMHLQIEQAIAEQYVPQIDAIIDRTQTLSTETRALLTKSPEKKDLLAANLEAQQLTIRAGGDYRQYLTEQAQQVMKARKNLENDIAAAWNTYETVRVSGELVGLVRSSRRLLDGLLNRQVPTLRTFQNLEMKREFETLTTQLRMADAS